MSLATGEVQSGGFVRDSDGRLVIVSSSTVAQETSGGLMRDQDGRIVVGIQSSGLYSVSQHRAAYITTGSKTSLASSIASETIDLAGLVQMVWAGAS